MIFGTSLIEPERERVFRLLEARPELGIHALRAALAAEGLAFGFGTVQRFLKRHGLERRKRLARRRKAAAKASATPAVSKEDETGRCSPATSM